MAFEMGAVKVGVAARKDLEKPPEASFDNILERATHAISIMAVEPDERIIGYLGKTDPAPYREHSYESIQLLGSIGAAMTSELESLGHRAKPVSPNGVYAKSSTPGRPIRPFSHRYAAHAAGVGAIARSGNVMSPEHGTRIYLSTVIADAHLVADGPIEANPCDDCKLCIQACPAGFMSESETVTFTLGGREVTHAAKRSHAACSIGCGGFSGLSRDGKWSTLAPSLIEVPDDDIEAANLFT